MKFIKYRSYIFSLIAFSALLFSGCRPEARHSAVRKEARGWTQYGGGPDQSKFFRGDEITPTNVKGLQLAWFYPVNDDNTYQFNPLIVDTTMYLFGKDYSMIAVNAITGHEIWIHAGLRGLERRGISYWESADGSDQRLIFEKDDYLQELDARTGKSILHFGDRGAVDLRKGLGRDPKTVARVQSGSPGAIFDNLVILGSSPGENLFSPPGYLRAYNVVTGKLVWTFHTVPLPGEYGYETWPPEAYKYAGGANDWGDITIDTATGLVYFPLGASTYDYYGADRAGANLFGDCLLALDARTGKRRWHFQMVHHDLWDYDPTAAPQLITVRHAGKTIKAVAQATKQGFLFVFDRLTGQPLWPVDEKAVPRSTMPGEHSWPTQPVPTVLPPFTRQKVRIQDLNPYLRPGLLDSLRRRIRAARTGLFQPLSNRYETVAMPGATGGANWGNTASDPDHGIVYVMAQEYPSIYKLSSRTGRNVRKDFGEKGEVIYRSNCQACHGADRKGLVGPSLVEIGTKIDLKEFSAILANGRGQMPGFRHLDPASISALFRFLGGNSGKGAGLARSEPLAKPLSGPVVDSGGAPGARRPPDLRATRMDAYPRGSDTPLQRYTTGYGLEYPDLLAPPWSTITAYDLNTGKIKWQRPLGEDPSLPVGKRETGVPNGSQCRGMVVTSTGIVFATAKGGKIYAYDASDGHIIWQYQLPRETEGLPSMYSIDGHQYLVVCATFPFTRESVVLPTDKSASGYYVFALPNAPGIRRSIGDANKRPAGNR